MSIHASIVGASGYVGGELLRLLVGHPQIEVAQVTSQCHAGRYVHGVHPNLRSAIRLKFSPVEQLEPCDLLFLALSHGKAASRIAHYAGLAKRVIDLSSDFRLEDEAVYRAWYGRDHPAPDWLSRFTYGLPELHREELASARYVSGVGCNATAVNLALWPLARENLIQHAVYRYPEPKILTGSNFCDVGFAKDERSNRLVVISAIDNLMKGAAGTAVQAMNLMYGWPEETELGFVGLHSS